jgi:outer membrane biosynthesis protein TonB
MTGAQQPLREEIDRAQDRLDVLEQDLLAVDVELSGYSAQQEQYRTLANICSALERLAELGVAGTFWGERVDHAQATDHIREVRARVAAFAAQIDSAENKRRSILDEIKQEHEVLGILEDDLHEIEKEEHERSLEWVVEREIGPLPDGPKMLWVRGGEEDLRLRRALAASLVAAALTSLLLPLVDVPLPEVTEVEKVPERIVRFIELDQKRAAPPPAIQEPQPQKPPEEKPRELVADKPPPAEPPPAAEQPAPVEPPKPRAQTAGILAFREKLDTIAERRPAERLGAAARIGNNGQGSSGPPQRSLITSLAPGSSGGINTAAFSRQLGGDGGGGGAIEGVEVGKVASTIGGGPSDGNGLASRFGEGALAGRTDEEIQIVFDRYKASLYRLYNRELRNDPTLRGQMVLKLTIEPDGSVSMCQLHASDMEAPTLASQVLERVKTFAFGAKDVPAITILYPIDFLPAA